MFPCRDRYRCPAWPWARHFCLPPSPCHRSCLSPWQGTASHPCLPGSPRPTEQPYGQGAAMPPDNPPSFPTSLSLSATRTETEDATAETVPQLPRCGIQLAIPSSSLCEPVLGADPVTSLQIKGGWDWGSKSHPGAHQPGSKSESSPCPLYYHIHSMKL